MKKKLKLFLSISSLCLALALLCFGVYAVQTVNYSLGGNVTYTVEDAFVEVQTKLYKSTTNLTRSQLGQKVNDVAEMNFTTVPEGLTLVDTSEVFSSMTEVAGTYEKPNLKFSTQAGSECYAYFFVINIKNLSPDINVWAVMEDEITNPANTVQINNELQQTIDTNGKNMVIGLSVDDFTKNIPADKNAFSYRIKIGVGDYALSEINLNKLTLTLDETNNTYSVKAKDTSVKGLVVIPEQYREDLGTQLSNVNQVSNAPAVSKIVGTVEDYAFSNCSQITSVIISNSATSIGQYAFCNCTNILSIKIPRSVISIGKSAFTGCTRLTEAIIENGVTSIGESAFQNCINLTSIKIPSSVNSIGNYLFDGCIRLNTVVIEEGLTKIGDYTFRGCKALTSIAIPDSVTIIEKEAISDCSGIRYTDSANGLIYIKNTNSDGTINNYFAVFDTVDENITACTINSNCKFVLELAFSNCTKLTSLNVPNSVKSMGEYAFSGCSGLTSITIPNNLTSLAWGVFSGCSGLTSITIPSSVTSVGEYAFSGCTGLKYTDADGLIYVKNTSSDGTINNYFALEDTVSENLTSCTISNDCKFILNSAFYGCKKLTSITIPSSVTNIGSGAFDVCSGLESIKVEAGNTVYTSRDASGVEVNCLIEPSTKTLMVGCNKSVIPTDGSVTSIGDKAFYYRVLDTVEIPETITSIGWGAFSYCSITSITIPESVTSIGDYAFSGYSGPNSITIPSSVTSMGDWVFQNWSSSHTIHVPFQEGNTPSGWKRSWKTACYAKIVYAE